MRIPLLLYREDFLRKIAFIFFLVPILAILAPGSRAQVPAGTPGVTGPSANTEAQRLLELKRLDLALQDAKAKRDRAKLLYDQGLGPQATYEAAEITYRQAQVDFQQAFLRLFADAPRLDVVSAIKYQKADGSKFVRVTVKNNSGVVLDYKLFGISGSDVQLPDQMKMRELMDIRVSLKEAATGQTGAPIASAATSSIPGAVISDPYSAYVPRLQVGESKTLDFGLLKDVDALVVGLYYNGHEEDRQIYLEKDPSANMVSLSAEEVSLEADLGSDAAYDLHLEQFTKSANPFSLVTVNLPQQIAHDFLEPTSNSRLYQVRFPEGVTSQKLQLKLYLPDKVDERVKLDTPLTFWALVMDATQAQQLDPSKTYTEAQIEALKCGRVRLQLIPRGVGKIEVSAPSLYQEIRIGDTVDLDLTVKNTGTRVVHNIHVSTENPLNWRTFLTPDTVAQLDPNQEEVVKLKIAPASDVGVGDYEVKVKTDAISNNRKVNTQDQSDRVHVTAPPNVKATAALIGSLLLLVGGIVVFGIRLTRR
jgi:NPCBM-associated, NEW3 domain of alpha-galactosidase